MRTRPRPRLLLVAVTITAVLTACSGSQQRLVGPQSADARDETGGADDATAASDAEICAAFRFLARQAGQLGGSDANASEDARTARLEFERTVAAAQPSLLRSRADGWLDAADAIGQQDPEVARLADAVTALIIVDLDPDHPYYQTMLDGGVIDEAARTLHRQTAQAAEDAGIPFSHVLAETDPAVNDAVGNNFTLSEARGQLDDSCGLS